MIEFRFTSNDSYFNYFSFWAQFSKTFEITCGIYKSKVLNQIIFTAKPFIALYSFIHSMSIYLYFSTIRNEANTVLYTENKLSQKN